MQCILNVNPNHAADVLASGTSLDEAKVLPSRRSATLVIVLGKSIAKQPVFVDPVFPGESCIRLREVLIERQGLLSGRGCERPIFLQHV